jgi:hypothetical protein
MSVEILTGIFAGIFTGRLTGISSAIITGIIGGILARISAGIIFGEYLVKYPLGYRLSSHQPGNTRHMCLGRGCKKHVLDKIPLHLGQCPLSNIFSLHHWPVYRGIGFRKSEYG